MGLDSAHIIVKIIGYIILISLVPLCASILYNLTVTVLRLIPLLAIQWILQRSPLNPDTPYLCGALLTVASVCVVTVIIQSSMSVPNTNLVAVITAMMNYGLVSFLPSVQEKLYERSPQMLHMTHWCLLGSYFFYALQFLVSGVSLC